MANSKRIAFILPFLYRYRRGIENSCVNLANALVELSQEVSLLTWREPSAATGFHLHPQIRVFSVPYFRYYRSRFAVPFCALNLLVSKYDVVNVFFAGYGEAQAIRLARRFYRFQTNFIVGYPIEQVPHRFEEFRKLGLEAFLDNIIVKSDSMVSGVADYFGRKVRVIPNGIDVDYFDPDKVDASALRRQFNFSPDDRVLLTVAALEERKGIQHVIHSLPSLIRFGLSVHYLVVGDGPYGHVLKSLAKKIGVQDRVHFVGSVVDVRPYYKLADVFCLLSYGEGFPNVLLEAWSMALPVVVSRHPPYLSIVSQNIGFVVDENCYVRTSKTIANLLSSVEVCQRMGPAVRRHVKRRYTWPEVAQRYLNLFLRIPVSG